MTTGSPPRAHRGAAALTALIAGFGLAGCSGSDSPDASAWAEAGAEAKRLLDETSGVTARLSTTDDPGSDYLSSASGTIIAEPPAFEGTVSGRVSGFEASAINVISVDGTLWVEAPVIGWTDDFKPAQLCAPDPALLLDPETGVGNVLTSSTDMSGGESERGGKDNEEIFHTYSGTASGEAIRELLPCAEGESFDATYRVDDEGYLRSAELTGVFFPDAEPVTYTIEVTDYDVEKVITAPE